MYSVPRTRTAAPRHFEDEQVVPSRALEIAESYNLPAGSSRAGGGGGTTRHGIAHTSKVCACIYSYAGSISAVRLQLGQFFVEEAKNLICFGHLSQQPGRCVTIGLGIQAMKIPGPDRVWEPRPPQKPSQPGSWLGIRNKPLITSRAPP